MLCLLVRTKENVVVCPPGTLTGMSSAPSGTQWGGATLRGGNSSLGLIPAAGTQWGGATLRGGDFLTGNLLPVLAAGSELEVLQDNKLMP